MHRTYAIYTLSHPHAIAAVNMARVVLSADPDNKHSAIKYIDATLRYFGCPVYLFSLAVSLQK